MTPEEMASDEMKKIRERLSREAFNDHQMAINSGTQSDLFKCNRCHQRNTTYNQVGNVGNHLYHMIISSTVKMVKEFT